MASGRDWPAGGRPILVAGPTASGKSALALALAARTGGVIINADAMQVYRELRILTARPSPDEEAQAPHRLYGHVAAGDDYSVARWLGDVDAELDRCRAEGARPIIVGGTGLYFKALVEGLSPVPPVPPPVREGWRTAAATEPPGALHARLAALDPEMAARLAPGDTQRIVRALEVKEGTGRSLLHWQGIAGSPVLRLEECVALSFRPPRALLHERCERRFDGMIAAGALIEVQALVALGLPPDRPAMRAIGVDALSRLLAGELTREAAVADAKSQTRGYVKRQETWARRHMMAWMTITTEYNCKCLAEIIPLIDP